MDLLSPTPVQHAETERLFSGCYRAIWISKNEIWYVALKKVLLGMRVVVYRRNSFGCVADYCAGRNIVLAIEITAALKAILSGLPESITEEQLYEVLPKWKVRPIDKDPCWGKIQELASRALSQSSEDDFLSELLDTSPPKLDDRKKTKAAPLQRGR